MKVTFKTAIICALVWIGFKLLGFQLGWNIPDESHIVLFVFTNMLGLLVAVSVGLYLQKRKGVEDDSILTDIKNGMASGVVYALIVSGFLYFYYEKIDPDFNKKIIAEREMFYKNMIDDPAKLKQLKDEKKEYETMTKEEILKNLSYGNNMFFSGKFMMMFGMLSMLMLSTLYSVLVTIIYRKILFRK